MKRFENCYGDIVTDEKVYYLEYSNANPREDFISIGDPEMLYGKTYRDAVKEAKKASLKYEAVDLCCEQWSENTELYCAPITIWRERYEKGGRVWRLD